MIYYCSNTGTGINKDINSPGDFIETLSILSPGDIIYLLPGEYFFNKSININCDNIKIEVYKLYKTDNNVIFNFKNIPYVCTNYNRDYTNEYIKNGNGINVYGNYIEINNISIKFAPFRGLQNFGNFNVFNSIETSYNCDAGHFQHGKNNLIINCHSHHNLDYKFIKNNEILYGFNSDGFADKLYKGNGNTYINCLSEFNGDDGFDFFQKETKDYPTIMKYCISSNNGLRYIDLSLNERLIEDTEYKNKYDISKYPNYGNGNGFKLGGIHKLSDIKIHHHNINLYYCVAISNNGFGFTNNHNSGTTKLFDCQALNNKIQNFFFKDDTEFNVYLNNCFSIPQNNNKIKKNNIKENITKFGNLIIYNNCGKKFF